MNYFSNVYLEQLEVGPMQNFVYLIGDKEKRECVIVDPAWDVEEIYRQINRDSMKVVGALVTHAHYDHVNGLDELLKRMNAKVYCNKEEAPFLKKWRSELKKVSDGDQLKVGDTQITFLHTPGHTPGSQCFLMENKLVSGDTLFIQACGRCDLPGGDAEKMYYSLKRLSDLGDKTILYPGHNYADDRSSTIGQEKRDNPYLQTPSLQEFLTFRMGLKP